MAQQQQYSDLPPGARVFAANPPQHSYSDLPPGAQIATPAQASPPQPVVAPAGNTIGAAPAPTLLQRARGVIANSAIGHSLEEGLPKVADALNLHPTETVNSPTYQSDREQLLAPQYLLPTPQSHVGHVARGVLTGAGNLTSGNSLATGAGIAATGGLVAPIAVGAGGAAAAARTAGTALRLGMAGVGAKGVYDQGKQAISRYNAGDTSGAEEAAGAMLPNAALTLPALSAPIEAAGNAGQELGVNLMDSYLKAGKKAYRYEAEPGRGILEEGPQTSIGLTRQGFSDKIAGAKADAGALIPQIVSASNGQIPRTELGSNVNSVLDSKRLILRGPGGNPSAIPRLDELGSTFDPHTSAPGYASVPEVYGIKRNQDENINWGRDLDPTDATVNNANREIRSNMASSLYNAAPELKAPSQRYANLSSAAKLADARTFDSNGSVFNPWRIAAGTAGGVTTGSLTHDPVAGLATGIATNLVPELWKSPAVKTSVATGLFQGGKGISALGRGLRAITSLPSRIPIGDAENYPQTNDPGTNNVNDGQQHSILPGGGGLYARTGVTPEIIRPDSQSRSKFGVGGDGRGGTLIRPLGRLPAPAAPPPEATPYTFGSRPVIGIPATSAPRLGQSVGSVANLVPTRLLQNLTSPGTPEEQAAALRRAQLGSVGNLLPGRIFSPPPAGEVLPPLGMRLGSKLRRID